MDQRPDSDFSDFVKSQHAQVFRTVYLITGDYQHAEDVVRATYVKALARWPKITTLADPQVYVSRMAINRARSWWHRPAARERVMELVDVVATRSSADDEHELVWSAVLSLPPRQRAVVVLRFYEDLSEAETAATLGVAVGTVEDHCHSACRKLSELLEGLAGPAVLGKGSG